MKHLIMWSGMSVMWYVLKEAPILDIGGIVAIHCLVEYSILVGPTHGQRAQTDCLIRWLSYKAASYVRS